MRASYQTKQRRRILEYLAQRADEPVTAKGLHAALQESGAPLGLATIYRQLEQLQGDGLVKKIVAGNGTGFQYVGEKSEEALFYLKCEGCGKLTQMDCHLLLDAADHLDAAHGFHVDATKSILYGRCQSCKS